MAVCVINSNAFCVEAHKGTHWYNNGEVNAQVNECPEGLVKGRLRKLADGKRAFY